MIPIPSIRASALLAVLVLAGLSALPARAGDGEKEKPTGAAKEDGAKKECTEKDCDEDAVGGACADGAKEGKDGSKGGSTRTDLEVVTLALVEGTSEAAKKVLAAVPAAAAEKVEAARRTALEQLARIQVAMTKLKSEFDAACADAKAKGSEACADAKAAYEKEIAALRAKSREQVELCAKSVRDALGEKTVQDLSAECRKAGDMAKAAAAKVREAAAKLLARRKAAEAEEEDDDEDEVDDGRCIGGEEKKPGDEKPGERKSDPKPDAKPDTKPESKPERKDPK